MSSEKKQVFHPIGMLSTIATIIREGFDIAEGQTEVLMKSHAKPHPVLSLTDINRIIQQAETSLEHVACAQKQLQRWQHDSSLTAEQRKEVNILLEEIPALNDAFSRLRQLAEDYKPKTIEAFMDKSDLEIGLEALARMFENGKTSFAPDLPPLDERLTIVSDFIDNALHESSEDLNDLTNNADCFWKSRAARIKDGYLATQRMAEEFGQYLASLPPALASTRLARQSLQRLPILQDQIRRIIAAAEAIEQNGPSLEDLKRDTQHPPAVEDTLRTLKDIHFTLEHVGLAFNASKGSLPRSVSDKSHTILADLEETQELHDAFMVHWKFLSLTEQEQQQLSAATDLAAINRAALAQLKAKLRAH